MASQDLVIIPYNPNLVVNHFKATDPNKLNEDDIKEIVERICKSDDMQFIMSVQYIVKEWTAADELRAHAVHLLMEEYDNRVHQVYGPGQVLPDEVLNIKAMAKPFQDRYNDYIVNRKEKDLDAVRRNWRLPLDGRILPADIEPDNYALHINRQLRQISNKVSNSDAAWQLIRMGIKNTNEERRRKPRGRKRNQVTSGTLEYVVRNLPTLEEALAARSGEAVAQQSTAGTGVAHLQSGPAIQGVPPEQRIEDVTTPTTRRSDRRNIKPSRFSPTSFATARPARPRTKRAGAELEETSDESSPEDTETRPNESNIGNVDEAIFCCGKGNELFKYRRQQEEAYRAAEEAYLRADDLYQAHITGCYRELSPLVQRRDLSQAPSFLDRYIDSTADLLKEGKNPADQGDIASSHRCDADDDDKSDPDIDDGGDDEEPGCNSPTKTGNDNSLHNPDDNIASDWDDTGNGNDDSSATDPVEEDGPGIASNSSTLYLEQRSTSGIQDDQRQLQLEHAASREHTRSDQDALAGALTLSTPKKNTARQGMKRNPSARKKMSRMFRDIHSGRVISAAAAQQLLRDGKPIMLNRRQINSIEEYNTEN